MNDSQGWWWLIGGGDKGREDTKLMRGKRFQISKVSIGLVNHQRKICRHCFVRNLHNKCLYLKGEGDRGCERENEKDGEHSYRTGHFWNFLMKK